MVVLSVFILQIFWYLAVESDTDTAPCFGQQILHPRVYLALLLNECLPFQAAVEVSPEAVPCQNCLISGFGFLLFCSAMLSLKTMW